jgi:biopolymer transport protein ExbB/TolQ
MSISFGWYQEGGPTMLLIALVAALGLIVLAERVYVIVLRSKNNGRPFIERTIQLVRAGKVDDAIKECAGSKAALPDIGLLILRSRSGDEAALQNVAGAAVLTVLPKLTRRLQYLSALAAAAVMLGAIGLFAGIHDSLIATTSFGPTSGAAAPTHDTGFAAACVPPIFGLAVAIVLLLGRAYLVSQAEAITEQIREYAARLINALLDRPDVRLGHR